MDDKNILEMHHISKSFPGVKAVDDMTLCVRKGSVHALMGENGAGKSTLMKILVGLYTMDEGEVWFNGQKRDGGSIKQVLDSGISMIYQELNPIDTVSVAENVYCGRIPSKIKGGLLVDRKEMHKELQELLTQLDITGFKPTTIVQTLSIAQKQLLEIVKALANNSKLIVMDEPTSALTELECQNLFKIIHRLKAEGMSFIYISHKMDEVFSLCDDLTVMRDGQYVSVNNIADITMDDVIQDMVGRELTDIYPKVVAPLGETLLEVKNLCSYDTVKNVSFDIKRGEILGFAGLIGAGRTETMETIFGCRPITSGEVYIDGEKVAIKAPKDAISHGVAFLTEDRRESGCFLDTSVYFNIMVLSFKDFINPLRKIRHGKCKQVCAEQVKKYGVKTTNIHKRAGDLSGGNQQKLLLARWLLPEPQIIILDEPTRGIDVGSKHEIYQEMNDLVAKGCSIIMVSSELPEILGMSDRIVVMNEGKITGILNRDEATQEEILRYASDLADGAAVKERD